jgi:hypothetical protein
MKALPGKKKLADAPVEMRRVAVVAPFVPQNENGYNCILAILSN